MTKAAKVFGKDLSHFMRSPATTEYVEALSALFADKEIIEVRRGSGLLPQVGTWGHPKLAVFFARWLDVKFAVFCDMVIDDILNKKAEMRGMTPTNATLTMSSREIAELTGKRHGDVIRDIRNMLEQLGDDANLRHVVETKDTRGYTDCFNLPKDLTITLVSGYNVQMRYAITQRWMELEAQQAPKLPTTFAEAVNKLSRLKPQRAAVLGKETQHNRHHRFAAALAHEWSCHA
jgi:phage regulator Rha-like protein